MGPDVIHLRLLRELADIVVTLLSIVFEKLWRSGDIPEDWKKANVTPIYKKASRRLQVIISPSVLLQSLGKLCNKSSWGLSQVK